MLPTHRFLLVVASLFTLFSSLIPSVAAWHSSVHNESFVPDAVLSVTESNLTQSCLSSKPVLLVNGSSPGPELRLTEGVTYWIRVYNDMPHHNLTMHWHGLTMGTSPFSDGTPHASSWPIPPLMYFDYEIHIPFGYSGTYFYHSHVGFQAISATGPLIVEDAGPLPYQYDEERIVFVQDVFTKTDEDIEAGLTTKPLIWSGESAMLLVNGLGGGTSNGTFCNASLTEFNIEPGKTYRMRFIAATALSLFNLAIEGHETLTVIEADGHYTQPYNTNIMQMGTGQRYSILFKAKDVPEKQTFTMQLASLERPTVTQGFAIINYGEEFTTPAYPPVIPPLTLPPVDVNYLEYKLRALFPEESPKAEEVTRTITITIHQENSTGATIWVQNGYPWTENTVQEPYLVSLYKNQNSSNYPSIERALANEGLDPISRAFPAEIGEVIEIIIQNTAGYANSYDTHPMHAHGEHYMDLGSGNGTYNQAENELKWQGATPVRRDTTMLYRYVKNAPNTSKFGWRAWRLRVTQPGVWMIHCHILQHMVMGMQTVWVFGNATELLGRVPYPEVQGYLEYGGSVMGNENRFPSVVEFYDDWTQNQ